MKHLLSLLLLLSTAAALQAQPLQGTSNIEQLEIAADSARANLNWYVALENYEKLYDETDDKAYLPVMALMNLKLRDVAAATRQYKQVFRRMEASDTTYNVHRYHYGRALKMAGEYEEAQTYLEQFMQHNGDERLAQFARMELEGIQLYKDAPEETNKVELELLDRKVNSSFSEYHPVLTIDGNTLYFSTWKATEPVVQNGEEDDYSRIFRAARNDKGEWQKPEALGKEVNRPGVQTANPALSADGRRLYFNRISLESHRITAAKIYMSEQEDDGWKSGNPVAGINSDAYLALQPTPGELFGREVIFFVSDMDGGFGGLDIYYANYEGEGRFGNPVNLGEQINTIGDDVTPFYFDGTLYWSTDGRPTMGGRDLFYAGWTGNNWTEPENMGPVFNSTVDDQSLSVYGEGLVGFMTSNREGGRSVKSKTCCDDIYGFEIAALYANLVVGLFNEAKEPLTIGNIQLKPIVNGEQIGAGTTKNRDDGNRYDFGLDLETQYMVVANSQGYFPDSVEVNTLGLTESKDFQQIFFLKRDPSQPLPGEEGDGGGDGDGSGTPVYDTIEIQEAIALENILYDFNDDKILPAAEGDLRQVVQIMNQYPEMVIELGSHTDTRGANDFNLNLSKRRAANARKWLIVEGGISGPRIKTQGYGETVPQTANARLAERVSFLNEGDVITDGFIAQLPTEELREQAHQLNRRTEFKVLEGPEEIIIRRDVIERRVEGANRNSLPEAKPVVPTTPAATPTRSAPAASPQKPAIKQQDPQPKITRFSSLYGQKDISGLPILVFEKREFDLGKVKHGESRTFTIKFTNKGPVPAKVMLTQACDCTTITHDDWRTYKPGESGSMQVVFDSTEKEESETITIDIFLEQEDKQGVPILEMVEYSYELVK